MLVEYRNKDNREVMLVPQGGIEAIDKDSLHDYRETAMFREIHEELGVNVQVLEHRMVGEVIREETGLRFYVFFVTKWIGELPEFTTENDVNHGKLVWLPIEKRYL